LDTLSQTNRTALRLRAIVSAREHGVNVVAKVFGVNTNTIRSWVKSFAAQDMPGLEYQPGRGRKSNVSHYHMQEILKWTKANPNITIMEIVHNMQSSFGIITSKSAIHRILKQLDLSYITPRPVHHKQDKETHEVFLNKSGAKTQRPST
jgi:transposase